MARELAFKIEYLGRDYHGWQFQDNANSVQEELEAGWLRLTGERLRFKASSRTDAGVSARGLVCHCRSSCGIPVERLPLALNSQLPPTLVVIGARQVDLDFSARHQSIGKYYCYRIFNRRIPSAFLSATSYHCAWDLQPDRWLDLVPSLLGEHDYAAFMDQGSPTATTVRRLDHLGLRQVGNLLELDVVGSGFLYHMVRIIAGTALAVMANKLSANEVIEAFEKRDRTRLGATLPAAGLTLEQVFFEAELFGQDDREAYLACCQGKGRI